MYHFHSILKHLHVELSFYLVKNECAYLLVAGFRHRAVEAGLSHSDLQDRSLVVGAGQKYEVVLKAKYSVTDPINNEHNTINAIPLSTCATNQLDNWWIKSDRTSQRFSLLAFYAMVTLHKQLEV